MGCCAQPSLPRSLITPKRSRRSDATACHDEERKQASAQYDEARGLRYRRERGERCRDAVASGTREVVDPDLGVVRRLGIQKEEDRVVRRHQRRLVEQEVDEARIREAVRLVWMYRSQTVDSPIGIEREIAEAVDSECCDRSGIAARGFTGRVLDAPVEIESSIPTGPDDAILHDARQRVPRRIDEAERLVH